MSLTDADKKTLLNLARQAVTAAAHGRPLPEPKSVSPNLAVMCGAFVTLKRQGRLRGCIGLIEGCYPLAEAVVRMAAAAALEDPRFPAVTPGELADLRLEISVLSPLKPVAGADEIVLGRDGVLIRCAGRSGLFLPQVAEETGWDKERFLGELCAGKAGLPPDAWRDPRARLFTFTVEILSE